MLLLDSIPQDTATLRAALAGALAPLGVRAGAVKVEGEYPNVGALRLDLTGARFHRELRPVRGEGEGTPAFFAREVAVVASPAHVEELPFTLSLRASDAVFAVAKPAAPSAGSAPRAKDAGSATAGAGAVLQFSRCGQGTLEIAVKHDELEAALTEVARAAAEKKGAELRSVRLALSAEGPRVLRLEAVAEAKAMFMTAKLTIAGRVEVNDALEVRLSGLTCHGDGMIANLAAGGLRSRLSALEGRVLPLRSWVPGLRSLVLDAEGGLRIRAEFGG
jgi:hypothetical protein